jgi:hypothetical protein
MDDDRSRLAEMHEAVGLEYDDSHLGRGSPGGAGAGGGGRRGDRGGDWSGSEHESDDDDVESVSLVEHEALYQKYVAATKEISAQGQRERVVAESLQKLQLMVRPTAILKRSFAERMAKKDVLVNSLLRDVLLLEGRLQEGGLTEEGEESVAEHYRGQVEEDRNKDKLLLKEAGASTPVKGMVKGAKGGAPGEGKEGGKDGEGGEGEGGGREELTSEDKVAEMTTRATQLEASARSLMMENGRLRQVRESRLSLFGGTHEYHWTSTTGRVPLDEYHWTSTAGRVPLDEYHWIERNTQQPRNMTFCTLYTCSLIPDTPPPRTKRIRAVLSPVSGLLSPCLMSPCLLSPVSCLLPSACVCVCVRRSTT